MDIQSGFQYSKKMSLLSGIVGVCFQTGHDVEVVSGEDIDGGMRKGRIFRYEEGRVREVAL